MRSPELRRLVSEKIVEILLAPGLPPDAEDMPEVARVASPILHRYNPRTMSMTFDIPSDVQAGVAGIADLDLRVALYLRHEAQLEAVRRQRHSSQAREIAAEAVRQAEMDKSTGFDWDESFAQLRQAHQDITARP